MFRIGEQISHYKEGVCEVVEIGPLKMNCSDRDREYYTLKPVFNPSGTLYIPVDGGEKQLRTLITEKEAKQLVEQMSEIPILDLKEEKKREASYKELLMKNDCTSWVTLIKTTYLRKRERIMSGKKVINVDERYLSNGERFLYGELAVALGKPREEMKEYLLSKMGISI